MRSLTVIYYNTWYCHRSWKLAAGAFVAPVIFFPQKYLGEGVLTHFQSGILMTQVFLKMNLLIGFVALYSIIYEVQVFMMRKNYDFFSFIASVLVIILTGLFILLYAIYYSCTTIRCSWNNNRSICHNAQAKWMGHESFDVGSIWTVSKKRFIKSKVEEEVLASSSSHRRRDRGVINPFGVWYMLGYQDNHLSLIATTYFFHT